jgi:hypothetical protein
MKRQGLVKKILGFVLLCLTPLLIPIDLGLLINPEYILIGFGIMLGLEILLGLMLLGVWLMSKD